MGEAVKNLYVHFPFCRGKCTYCALCSKAGVSPADREAYVNSLTRSISSLIPHPSSPLSHLSSPISHLSSPISHYSSPISHYSSPLSHLSSPISTIYFGGGSPVLCDLRPLFKVLNPLIDKNTEFSVELHPLDVTEETLQVLKDGGVNRISMGLQSLNDDVLKHMRRGYSFKEAEKAFRLIKEYFDNAGVDLIIGYPGDSWGQSPRLQRLADWGLKHCSAYSLILEENSVLFKLTQTGTVPPPQMGTVPLKLYSDEEIMDELSFISHFLNKIGLNRYEISNYSAPGYECRHNMATWNGEDYYGIGIGAHGRIGLKRTRNWRGQSPEVTSLLFPQWGQSPEVETVSEEFDFKERKIFSLRTARGLDAGDCPHWIERLDRFAEEGLLEKENLVYRLTERGFEVCDSILAELI